MASFSTFGGATRFFTAITMAALTVLGAVTLRGTVTITGPIVSTSTVREIFIGPATTTGQVAGASQNDGSLDRILGRVFVAAATSTPTGGAPQRVTISLSQTQAATGTGANLLYDGMITIPPDNSTTSSATSTVLDLNVVWKIGWYLNCLIASPTTTISWTCGGSYL